MKVSVLYGKRITNAEGIRGYVLGVNAREDKLACLVCADGNENIFAVDFEKIKSVKERITFSGECTAQPAGEALRLGKPVYDCVGNFLGTLTELTTEGNKIKFAHVGKIKFAYTDIINGDAIIVRNSARILKSDIVKNGRVILKRGTPVTDAVLDKAAKRGEYVQTSLKCL